MLKKAIGKRIVSLCEERGITVNALAVKANIPPSTLKNIVYGQVESTGVETIFKICAGLSISVQEFFSTSDFDEYYGGIYATKNN